MASVRIHPPHVLATLPRPLDHTQGRITARPVMGIRRGDEAAKRPRKRKEVVSGIDGEAVSIYDVSTARLITSYPIPPQESFSCAPYSIRIPLPGKGVARYTFASTADSAARKLTLFKDVVDGAGKTVSTTVRQSLPAAANLIHIELVPTAPGGAHQLGSLVTVCSTGTVACFDAETLAKLWSESALELLRGSVPADLHDHYRVCFATATTSADDSEWLAGLQGSRTATKHRGGLLLGLIASAGRGKSEARHVLMLGADSNAAAAGQRLAPLHVAPIPSATERDPASLSSSTASYRIDMSTGQLLEATPLRLLVYNLAAVVPKLVSAIENTPRAAIPLSPQTALVCNGTSVSVYNHVYRWTQASAPCGVSDAVAGSGQKLCALVGYFGQLDIAVALLGNSLVTIPIEASQRGSRKRRFDGRLIDAIGQGETSLHVTKSMDSIIRDIASTRKKRRRSPVEFEMTLAQKFGVEVVKVGADKAGGGDGDAIDGGDPADEAATPTALEWKWMRYPSHYPLPELRWVWFAIESALTVVRRPDETLGLASDLPNDNVLTYLVAAGHLTLSNLRKGLKEQLASFDVSDGDLGRELVRAVIEVDPTMHLLAMYVAATQLGAAELLMAVHAFMDSLGVLERTTAKAGEDEAAAEGAAARALPSADLDEDAVMADAAYVPSAASKDAAPKDTTPKDAAPADVDDMLIDQLEAELAVAEFHFNEAEKNTRNSGLMLALAKLASCPTAATVKAMRTIFRTGQILSLILLLRRELVKGAWTTRYVEQAALALDEHGAAVEPPPDDGVSLIASLISRCLDAVGPRAWFLNDDVTFGDRSEAGSFLKRLSTDVRDALEGLQEAVYLQGILGEVVRYGTAAPASSVAQQQQQQQQQSQQGKRAPAAGTTGATMAVQQDGIKAVRIEPRDAHVLPLGAPKSTAVDVMRVDIDGELARRSHREIAMLKSKQVGKYSLERLFV